MNAIQTVEELSEQLRKSQWENIQKIREISKLTAEFRQIIGLLKSCRDALHELRCYDADFYDRTCGGLIPAIDTHLGLKQHEPEPIHPRTP